MIFGDINFYLVRRAGSHLPENIVGDAQRRDREPVSMKVERIFIVGKEVPALVWRVGWQIIGKKN
jgi:hypothetical protein